MQEYEYTYEGAEFYCYPETKILINKFGIRDAEELDNAERKITALKILEFEENPFKPTFDFSYFCKVHQYLFCDIYEWAGKIREGEFMFKGDSMFYRACFIESGFNEMYEKLKAEKFLKGLAKEDFCQRMAYYMGFLNAIHPFRDGNGRTMRLYFRQLAINAGYNLQFSKVTKEELLQADIAAFNCDYEPLAAVLDKIATN